MMNLLLRLKGVNTMNRNNRSEYDANLSMAKYVKRESRFSEKNKRKARIFNTLKNNAWMLACVFGFGYLFIIALLEAI
jgi:hypothetical protein